MLMIFNRLFLRKSLKTINLKEKYSRFPMKVTTTPRDCDKVKKIIPIMQEHLGSGEHGSFTEFGYNILCAEG